MGEFIKFNHWRTGELTKRELSNAYPSESITKLICPFDSTKIFRWHDGHGDKGYSCPNCNTEYLIQSGTQDRSIIILNNIYKISIKK
jgi:hypothetical protein